MFYVHHIQIQHLNDWMEQQFWDLSRFFASNLKFKMHQTIGHRPKLMGGFCFWLFSLSPAEPGRFRGTAAARRACMLATHQPRRRV